jgi:hypothetical protein
VRFEFNGTASFSTRPAEEEIYRSAAIRISKTNGGYYIQCGSSSLHADVGGALAEGCLDSTFWNSDAAAQREFFLLAFLMLLRPHGLYGLHANAAAADERGVLIVGPSGAGKTTLCGVLTSQGWRYAGDDAVMLRQSPGGVEAHPFRRAVAESLVAANSPQPCHVRAIVFPRITARPRSRLVALDPTQALVGLIQQSPGILADRGLAGRQLAVLQTLASHARCYRLLFGADAFDEPALISRTILEAL